MALSDILLTDPLDLLYLHDSKEKYRAMVRRGLPADGMVVHAVNTKDNTFVEVVTKGEEEFVLYCVFVAKIRRDNERLPEQPPLKQREWYELAKAFIDEFGDRSPRDIIEEFKAVKAHFKY